jgi:hypothetical protein
LSDGPKDALRWVVCFNEEFAMSSPTFQRYIGIDYSGAACADTSLPGLRVYEATPADAPVEVLPPPSPRKYWTRRGIAEWLEQRLGEGVPSVVGIDHGFSFPLRYFETFHLEPDWLTLLDYVQQFCPADKRAKSVEMLRMDDSQGFNERMGSPRWRRLTEERAGAKSVFHFDVPGSVAKSTLAGLPWLRYLRSKLGPQVHFWPLNGWEVPTGRSVLAEVYPSLWSKGFPKEGRTSDQHDAFVISAWLRQVDGDGTLNDFFKPQMPPQECTVAKLEGWILGVR